MVNMGTVHIREIDLNDHIQFKSLAGVGRPAENLGAAHFHFEKIEVASWPLMPR
jgi:hypothetical protein